MTYEEFLERVKKEISGYLPKECAGADISIQEATKNNDQKLYALCIQRPGERVVPRIYLESFYQRHRDGWEMDNILSVISRTYQESMAESARWQDFRAEDYESVKDSLFITVLNKENNQEYLRGIVHKDIPETDITAILRVNCSKVQDEGNASFMVKEEMLETWGIAWEELYEQALRNTEKLFPPKMLRLGDFLCGGGEGVIEDKTLQEDELYFLGNDSRNFGATVMLYPSLLQEIGEATRSNFFILPSSIHELILIKTAEGKNAEELQRIVMEINRSKVSPEEVLSDEVYSYDYQEQKLVMATDPARTKEYVEQMDKGQECWDNTEETEFDDEMER